MIHDEYLVDTHWVSWEFFFKKNAHEFLCHVKKALGDGLFTPHLVSTQGKAKGGKNCLQIFLFKKKGGN
jgi:hypothetical protein